MHDNVRMPSKHVWEQVWRRHPRWGGRKDRPIMRTCMKSSRGSAGRGERCRAANKKICRQERVPHLPIPLLPGRHPRWVEQLKRPPRLDGL
eukprot:312671-Chlamydomonas_euryale.AAC.1